MKNVITLLLIVGMIFPIFILINSAIRHNKNFASNVKIIILIIISIVVLIFAQHFFESF